MNYSDSEIAEAQEYQNELSADRDKRFKKYMAQRKVRLKKQAEKDAEMIKKYPESSVTKLSDVHWKDPKKRKFYNSKEWKELSASFREKNKDSGCTNCKRTGIIMVADHINPVRFFWDQRLDENKLQILCRRCNEAKLNKVGPYALEALENVVRELKIEKEEYLLELKTGVSP